MLCGSGRELVRNATSLEPVDVRVLRTRGQLSEPGVLGLHELLQWGGSVYLVFLDCL
jgi:hypothetical protein